MSSDDFFSNWGNKFKNSLRDKLPIDVFTDFMEDIKDITSARAENITVFIYGKDVTVLSFDWYYKYKNDIDDVIKGCTFVILVFYNINMVYFAIRGTRLFNLNSFEGDLYYIQQNTDKIL